MSKTHHATPSTKPDTHHRVEPRRFRPLLNLGHQQALNALIRELEGKGFNERIQLIRGSIDAAEAHWVHLTQLGVESASLRPTTYFLATLRLLRDLSQQGWTAGMDDDGIYMLPPVLSAAGADPQEAKSDIRDSFQFALADQLNSASVAKFIARLERAGVASLFAQGSDLASRLDSLGPSSEISEAVRPVLQLVDASSRDPHTGLKLQDIWRYARLQWSIPYQQTPGRNLHYLVRDAAASGEPIIGIAALGNAILGLSQRDEALGWSVNSLKKRFDTATEPERTELARHLVRFLGDEEQAVFRSDLDFPSDDTDEVIAYLGEVQKSADTSRRVDLDSAGERRTEEYNAIREVHEKAASGIASDEDWAFVATTNLYRRKRAGVLADIIRAKSVFERYGVHLVPRNLERLFDNEEGRRAIEATLRRIKQKAIAENVMEIITCGAVAPYNQILGGKLVSMLMASPQVVEDFARRYEGRVSLIASGMAGKAVVRVPKLSVLTTSSLYAMGSAQYNRIRVPGTLVVGGSGEVRFDRIGQTDSYGTVQFASDTTQDLSRVARFSQENRRVVNNLFGEGMSPKLRSLRMGLEGLGLLPEEYLRHHSPRLLYAVPLVENPGDVLLGLAEPDYVFPVSSGHNATEAIAGHWYSRWAKSRIARVGAMESLRDAPGNSNLLSLRAAQFGDAIQSSLSSFDHRESSELQAPMNSAGPISFVEKLYRNSHSYADRLNEDELSWISVDLGLDEFIIKEVGDGKQVIITGNPGDGKTFAIERIRSALESAGALVITDANAASDSQVLSSWRSCDENERPLVLAINEWPLFELQRLARQEGFEPVGEAIRQVRSAVFFGAEPESRKGLVSVVDLNLRNVLAERVVVGALGRLTDARFTADLDSADPAQLNTARLRSERVQQRLVLMLEHVSRSGQHVTMRQLMGFLAFLLTGGTDAGTRIRSQGDGRFLYSNLAYERSIDGGLFGMVVRAFDPARITHPYWDEALWRGTTNPSDWLDPSDVPVAAAGCSSDAREECFRTAKRRFFFEHAQGEDLIRVLPRDESEFDQVLLGGIAGDPELVRRVTLAINRFFEPDASREEEKELKLWQSHRYDVRPPTAFVALHSKRSEDLGAVPPSYAEWVQAWLSEDLRRTGYFAIESSSGNDEPSRLLIDRDLFLTLREAAAGLGRSTWSRSVSRKITRFVDGLHRQAYEQKAISDLEIRNVDTNLRAIVKVNRDGRRYEL